MKLERKAVYAYFDNEYKHSKELYIDSIGHLNSTLLAENYINSNNIKPEHEEDIFELVIDWMDDNVID